MTVTSNGHYLGRIQEAPTCCSIRLDVFGSDDTTKLFEVNGSLFKAFCHLCNDVKYDVGSFKHQTVYLNLEMDRLLILLDQMLEP